MDAASSPGQGSLANQSDDVWKRARSLLEQGNLEGSRREFQRLIDLGVHSAEGHYGVGLIQFRLRDLRAAKEHFESCLKLNPRHANACYYLGEICHVQGDMNNAAPYFRRALQINPTHSGALKRLRPMPDRLQDQKPSVPEVSDAAMRPGPPSPQQFGVYELIRNDPSPLARQAIGLIDATEMSVRPNLSAYLGKFLAAALIPLALGFGAVVAATFGHAPTEAQAFLLVSGVIVSVALVITLMLKIKTTEIVINQGRAQVRTGIFAKQTETFEFYRVLDIELRRTFLNRLTHDGTVAFFVEGVEGRRGPKEVELTGIAKAERLEELFNQLRSLIFVMRSGQWGKGIIY